MKTIQTMNGEMHIDDLGLIGPHEHIFIDIRNQYAGDKGVYGVDGDHGKVDIKNLGYLRRDCYLMRDNLLLDDLDTAIEEVAYFKRAGGDTLIDLSLRDIDRDMLKLKAVSDATGVNIVAGCGWYTYDTIPEKFEKMSVGDMSDIIIRELTEGVDGTGLKPGVIGEIGTSDKIYPIEEKSLRAAAIASRETKAPIYIHTYPWGDVGGKALDILEEYEVPPSRVCICHLDVQFNYDYMTSLLKRGAFVEFDDFGKEFYIIKKPGEFAGGAFASDVERVHMLMRLVEAGYQDRLLLTNDVCLKMLLHSYGGWGYDHTLTNIVPMMKSEGMSEQIVNQLIYDNPKRFLSGE